MRKGTILAATMPVLVAMGLLVSGEAFAQNRPAPPPEDMFATPNRPGWSVEERSGCWIWNQNPKTNESIHWSASCAADGRATGHGTLEWRVDDNVTRYEGDYRDGKANGRGVLMAPDGGRYEGDFRDSVQHGRGVYNWPNGARYEGEWQDGKPHGRGAYRWSNGARYEGEWQDGKPHGRGVATHADGGRYEGDYRDSKPNGRGVFAAPNGYRYEGDVRDGQEHGRGVATYADGGRFEGGFKNGLAEGFGEYTLNGEKILGIWARGCISAGDQTIALGRPLSECP